MKSYATIWIGYSGQQSRHLRGREGLAERGETGGDEGTVDWRQAEERPRQRLKDKAEAKA